MMGLHDVIWDLSPSGARHVHPDAGLHAAVRWLVGAWQQC